MLGNRLGLMLIVCMFVVIFNLEIHMQFYNSSYAAHKIPIDSLTIACRIKVNTIFMLKVVLCVFLNNILYHT